MLPRLWGQSFCGAFTCELDSVIPVGTFQLRMFCDFLKEQFAMLKRKQVEICCFSNVGKIKVNS